jgi:EAL domain-containing protein (putative c-di-GMP-specific phosphodiesterase class I)
VAESFCRVAEDLVRAGGGDALRWEGYELSTHFQPIYSVRREACLGYEALIRARTDDGRDIGPQLLFADAFAHGRGVQLDWICRALHLRNFARVDPGDRKLYLNVHPEAAVQDSGSASEFGDLASFYGVAPRRLCVEILEDGCADEPLLRKVVAAYRALGCAIAMDDFGLGRSNFDRIVSLRPDLVKIDRSILAAAVGDAKSGRMLTGIIELLHEAGSQVAVEGVESAHEALVALEAGADQLQGHYFATPALGLGQESFGSSILVRLGRMRATGVAAAG